VRKLKVKKMPLIKNELNPLKLIKASQDLKSSLQEIAPDNSKTTKIITFALVSTALVGMFVYHYIKNQEALS
jgi:hypothetical protein